MRVDTISGTNMVIGASQTNGDGEAYFYRDSGSAWTQVSHLSDPFPTAGEQFAESVAIDGTQAVVGAFGAASGGEAFFYGQSGGTWSETSSAVDPVGTSGDFGFSVAIDAHQALVGAPGDATDAGSATFYEYQGGAWQVLRTVTDPTNVSGDYFGAAVSLSSSNAAIGAYGAAYGTGGAALSGAGEVYVYNHEGQWTDVVTLSQETPTAGENFGLSVGLDGDTLVSGAPGSGSTVPEVDFFSQITAQSIYAHAPASINAGALVSVASPSSAGLSVSYDIDSSSTASGCQVNAVGDVSTPADSTGGTCVVVLSQYGSATVAAAQELLVTVNVAAIVPQRLVFKNTRRTASDLSGVVLVVKGGYPSRDLKRANVSYSVTGAGCSISRGVLRASRATSCVVRATQTSANFPKVRSRPLTFTFVLAPQRPLTLSASATRSTLSRGVLLGVRGGSGPGAVTLHLSGAGCTVVLSTLRAHQATSCRVSATKAASALYAAASSNPVVVVFAP